MSCRSLALACLSLALAAGCQFSSSTSSRGAPSTAEAKETREVTGRIASYTTAPRGEMDGFILDTGNRVHFPVHTGSALLPHVHKGAEVRVVGTLVDRPEGKVIEAISITNIENDRTLEIASITPPKPPEPAAQGGVKPPGKTESTTTLTGAELTSREGRVRGYTTAPNGDMDGLLLDTGIRVHFPSNAGRAVLPHVGQGKTVRVVGWEVSGPEGTILEATKIIATPGGQTVDIAEVAAPPVPAVTPGAVAPPGQPPLGSAPPAKKVR